jgi:hypothetical protein
MLEGLIEKSQFGGAMFELIERLIEVGSVSFGQGGRVDTGKSSKGEVGRIDRRDAHRRIRAQFAGGGFIERQQLDEMKAHGARKIAHRQHTADIATPEIVGGIERKERDYDGGNAANHWLVIGLAMRPEAAPYDRLRSQQTHNGTQPS